MRARARARSPSPCAAPGRNSPEITGIVSVATAAAPAKRRISGSKLTIIGSYRGVAWPRKIGTRGVIRSFRTFRRARKRDGRVRVTRTQMPDYVPRVQTKSPAASAVVVLVAAATERSARTHAPQLSSSNRP